MDNNIGQLHAVAQGWKDNYELYKKQPLTAKEKHKLGQVSNISKLAGQLISGDTKLKDESFKWILRDNNNVEALEKFPEACKKIKSCLLAGRIGRFAATSLKVEGDDLTLPFEVQKGDKIVSERISILDGKRVVNFRGNYSLTIDAIFQIFKNKNDKPGNLEYFGKNGITNFNVSELGWWNEQKQDYERIDLNQPKWWEDLPVYEDKLTKLQVRKRFNLEDFEDDEWVVVVRASTESLGLDIDKSHGFIGIVIPEGDGTWRIYDFGKYAESFPTSLIAKLFMLGNTVKAKINYFDENDIYSQRLQAKTPLIFTPEQGLMLMDEIKNDIIKAREGNIVFQFAWENCAYWPSDLIQRVLKEEKNFFRAPANLATPKIQPLKSIFSLISKCAKWIQTIAFRALEYLLLGWRKVNIIENGQSICKCVTNSGFHKIQEMYHPGFLHQQILSGQLPGVITFGHLNVELEVA